MTPQFMVINADDFGISGRASQEIARCIKVGRVSSTTMMANLKGFDEAVELAKAGRFTDRIGVHLNFSTGNPLSDLPSVLRAQDGGLGIPVRRVRAPREWIDAVEVELRAQVARVVAAGIRPTHLDSHEHWHNSFPWTQAVLRVAKCFDIRMVRPARNRFYERSVMKTGFKVIYNNYLSLRGFRGVRYFTDVKPWFQHVHSGGQVPEGPIELMCHPAARLTSPMTGWVFESDLLMSDQFGECLQGTNLVSYLDLLTTSPSA